jgi:hypothetical protein
MTGGSCQVVGCPRVLRDDGLGRIDELVHELRDLAAQFLGAGVVGEVHSAPAPRVFGGAPLATWCGVTAWCYDGDRRGRPGACPRSGACRPASGRGRRPGAAVGGDLGCGRIRNRPSDHAATTASATSAGWRNPRGRHHRRTSGPKPAVIAVSTPCGHRQEKLTPGRRAGIASTRPARPRPCLVTRYGAGVHLGQQSGADAVIMRWPLHARRIQGQHVPGGRRRARALCTLNGGPRRHRIPTRGRRRCRRWSTRCRSGPTSRSMRSTAARTGVLVGHVEADARRRRCGAGGQLRGDRPGPGRRRPGRRD